MASERKIRIGRLFSNGRLIDEAVRSAARQAVLLHEKKNVPVVVWRDGKVALMSPGALRRSLRIKKK